MVMATSLLLGACGGENADVNPTAGNENVIGRSDIRIEGGRMTPEALWAMGRIGGLNVSPDGKRVVYTVAYYSVPQNKSNREVFVMNADGTDNKQITRNAFQESNAVWIKGGTKIAFLSNEGGSSQLWEMNPDGGERKQLSQYEDRIESIAKERVREFLLEGNYRQGHFHRPVIWYHQAPLNVGFDIFLTLQDHQCNLQFSFFLLHLIAVNRLKSVFLTGPLLYDF